MKATNGQGFDVVSPTNNRNLQWEPLGILQPIDMNRVPIDLVNPAMADIGPTGWNFEGKGSHWLPHIWGTEGIGWRTDLWTPEGDVRQAMATSGARKMLARPWAARTR